MNAKQELSNRRASQIEAEVLSEVERCHASRWRFIAWCLVR